jgi:hypothetical protein
MTPALGDSLRRHRAVWVLPDQVWMPGPLSVVERLGVATGPFAYLRLRGDREAVDALTPTLDHIGIDQGEQAAEDARATGRGWRFALPVPGRTGWRSPAGSASASPRPATAPAATLPPGRAACLAGRSRRRSGGCRPGSGGPTARASGAPRSAAGRFDGRPPHRGLSRAGRSPARPTAGRSSRGRGFAPGLCRWRCAGGARPAPAAAPGRAARPRPTPPRPAPGAPCPRCRCG